MLRKWKKISSKLVYQNPWIKIHEDTVFRPDGQRSIYSYLEKPAGNCIIALDDNNCTYLVKEYRYPLKKNILQLPTGALDTHNILQQAKKELLKETGLTAKKWRRLGGFYVAAGHETTFMNVVLATQLDVSDLKTSNQEADEMIQQIVKVSLSKLKHMILDQKIVCGITLAALNLFFLKYNKK